MYPHVFGLDSLGIKSKLGLLDTPVRSGKDSRPDYYTVGGCAKSKMDLALAIRPVGVHSPTGRIAPDRTDFVSCPVGPIQWDSLISLDCGSFLPSGRKRISDQMTYLFWSDKFCSPSGRMLLLRLLIYLFFSFAAQARPVGDWWPLQKFAVSNTSKRRGSNYTISRKHEVEPNRNKKSLLIAKVWVI